MVNKLEVRTTILEKVFGESRLRLILDKHFVPNSPKVLAFELVFYSKEGRKLVPVQPEYFKTNQTQQAINAFKRRANNPLVISSLSPTFDKVFKPVRDSSITV